jgi:hypothetical protein
MEKLNEESFIVSNDGTLWLIFRDKETQKNSFYIVNPKEVTQLHFIANLSLTDPDMKFIRADNGARIFEAGYPHPMFFTPSGKLFLTLEFPCLWEGGGFAGFKPFYLWLDTQTKEFTPVNLIRPRPLAGIFLHHRTILTLDVGNEGDLRQGSHLMQIHEDGTTKKLASYPPKAGLVKLFCSPTWNWLRLLRK